MTNVQQIKNLIFVSIELVACGTLYQLLILIYPSVQLKNALNPISGNALLQISILMIPTNFTPFVHVAHVHQLLSRGVKSWKLFRVVVTLHF